MKGFAIREGLAFRQLGDSTVIVDPKTNKIHTLNEVGSFAWSAIESGTTDVDRIVAAMVEAFEVSEGQARKDLEAFLSELREKDLISFTDGD